jgi:hypothetical protein
VLGVAEQRSPLAVVDPNVKPIGALALSGVRFRAIVDSIRHPFFD